MRIKKIRKEILVGALVLFLLIGGSYAWFKIQVDGGKQNILRAGTLSLYLDETQTEGINIEGAVPTSDKKGLTQTGYNFKLVNNGKTTVNYTIYLDDLGLEEKEKRMPDEMIRYNLIKNGEEGEVISLNELGTNPKRIVDKGVIEKNTTNTYNMKVWMSEEATNEIMGTVFSSQLRVETEQANIKAEESDMTIDINDPDTKLELEDDISNYEIESSDSTIAIIDNEGKIVKKGYGKVTFKIKNKVTGAKKNITVTITKTLTATYVKQTGVKEIEKEKDTCVLEEKEQTSCSITPPTITPEEGYTAVGWSKEKTSHEGEKKIDISEDTNIYTITKKNEITYTATFNKPSVGVESITNTTLSCTIPEVYNEEQQETSCKIQLPMINTKEGYTAIGWNEDKNAITGLSPNTEIELTGNKEFYGIIKKDAITLSATFYRNGAKSLDGDTSEYVKKSCVLEEKYNGEAQKEECEVITPTIEASENTPNVVGYSEEQDSIIADLEPNTTIKLNGNKEYYAITKSEMKTITATFYKNGSESLDNSKENYITKICNILGTYNGKAQEESCKITSPIIEASKNTPVVIGYSKEEENHQSEWDSNIEKSISESSNYYAQTKKEKVTYTATYKVGKNVVSVEREKDSCEIPEVYNGNTQNKSCNVEGGEITPKTGYTSVGYSEENGSTTGNTTLELTSDKTYYANAVANSYRVEYYNGSTKLGESGVKVDEELTLPTITSLNGEKEGYSFKGWTKTNGSETVEYTDGETVTNLATKEGEVVKLYAVYKDDIKPVCTFSNTKEIYVTEEDTIDLTCTDLGSKIKNTTLQVSNFETSNDNGSIVSVSTPVEIENGYKYSITVKGLKAGATETTNGSFTISLKENSILDDTGNGNIKTTSEEEKVKGYTYTQEYTKDIGVDSITSTKTSCTTILDNLTCKVALPGITESKGYVKEGWYYENNKIGEPNTTYTLTKENNGQTLVAKARVAIAEEIGFDNTKTQLKDSSGNECSNVQCALDSISRMIGFIIK